MDKDINRSDLHIYQDDKTGNYYYYNGKELVLLGNRTPKIGDTGDSDFQEKENQERAEQIERRIYGLYKVTILIVFKLRTDILSIHDFRRQTLIANGYLRGNTLWSLDLCQIAIPVVDVPGLIAVGIGILCQIVHFVILHLRGSGDTLA